MVAFVFEALLWITDIYSAVKDKCYFSWFYLSLSHGRRYNMEDAE